MKTIGHFRVPKTLTHEAKCKPFVVQMSIICMRIKKIILKDQWLRT